MSSASPSSTPRRDMRWDNRNSGFVSPSQLQQWKQQEALQQQQLLQQQRGYVQQQGLQEAHETRQPSAPAEAPQHSSSQHQLALFRTTSRPESTISMSGIPNSAASSTPTHSRTTSAFSFFKRPTHTSSLSTSSVRPDSTSSLSPLVNEFGQASQSASSHQSMSEKGPPSGVLSHVSGEKVTSPGIGDKIGAPPVPIRSSTTGPSNEALLPPLHPEIRSIVQLKVAHGRKIYHAGPLVRRLERQADGQRPLKDDGWRDVFAQLGGTILSLWDMKEVEEANKQGKQVPPSYINVTDAVSSMTSCLSNNMIRRAQHERSACFFLSSSFKSWVR